MEYRGSKSGSESYTRGTGQYRFDLVKEQRVDGSSTNRKSTDLVLRCTLQDFKRKYQVKILSKQINYFMQTRFYSKDGYSIEDKPSVQMNS